MKPDYKNLERALTFGLIFGTVMWLALIEIVYLTAKWISK